MEPFDTTPGTSPRSPSAGIADLIGPVSEWRSVTSGQAELKLSTSSALSQGSPALRLDWNFHGAGGFVVARRPLHGKVADDFNVRLRLRGEGATNDLEIKLVDAAGDSVWRCTIKGLKLSQRWRELDLPARLFEFGWGPASGGRPSQLGALEFALVAGEGGTGWMLLADIAIVDAEPPRLPQVLASSVRPGSEVSGLLDVAGWEPHPEDRRPWVQLDLHAPRDVGGLIIDWLDGLAPASGFRLRSSNDGRRWKTAYDTRVAGGRRSYVRLPGLRCSQLRLELRPGRSTRPCRLRVELQPYEFSRSVDAFWQAIAQREPRGSLPRWLLREQSYWTMFGAPQGQCHGLIDEQGMIEPDRGGFCIEPMLWLNDRLYTWADVECRQHLAQGWMPLPAVRWQGADWLLVIDGQPATQGGLRMRYAFSDASGRARDARLFLLVRPIQLTPSWQSWRGLGGMGHIASLQWQDGAVSIDGRRCLVPVSMPAAFGAQGFDEGQLAGRLHGGDLPERSTVEDPAGAASAVLSFDLGQTPQVLLDYVREGTSVTPHDSESDWLSTFDTAMFQAPGWGVEALKAMYSAGAQVLAARDGAALQPGTRRYTRSWIRDGASMASALLRLGRQVEPAEYLRWYLQYQRDDGFVPCCVDREGPDWLVEHDSHGQLIALLADIVSFTQDEALLRETWPAVEKAAVCMESLIDDTGLLPISASHEGYLAQPVHSYWDDFWAIRGLRDAAMLASRVGDDRAAARWSAFEGRLSSTLARSIEATRQRAGLDFIPGSLEWADLDPSATAKALSLLDLPPELDRRAVERTFELYLADWRAKRSGQQPWTQYSAYEIRIIDTLVRLGWREAALELLRFFLDDRRPAAWNQWPEITWREWRAPGHLGDLPHCWIAAEYVLAVRSLFVFESESAQALVLAAGLAPEWLEGEGATVKVAPTSFGTLSYSLRRMAPDRIEFRLDPGIEGRILLRPPLPGAIASVVLEGIEHADFDATSVSFAVTASLPRAVRLELVVNVAPHLNLESLHD